MLIEVLRSDLKESMKNKNTIKKNVIQLLINGINNSAKDKKSNLNEQEEFSIVQKELKQTRESLDAAVLANRSDLIDDAKIRIEILEAYLPQQLNEDQIRAKANEKIEELNLDLNNKSILMKNLMPLFKGIADGKLVNKVISEISQGK